MDLDGVSHGGNDRRQEVKRNWRAVELAASMVRQDDGIHSCVGEASGVVDVLHALDGDGARPLVANPG
jgi:hypothetical protein